MWETQVGEETPLMDCIWTAIEEVSYEPLKVLSLYPEASSAHSLIKTYLCLVSPYLMMCALRAGDGARGL
jgi:hypothetical protein